MDQYLSVVYYFIVWIFFLNDGIEEKMITFIPSHFYCFSSFLSKFCSLYKWHTIESKQVEKEKKIGVIWQFFFFGSSTLTSQMKILIGLYLRLKRTVIW